MYINVDMVIEKNVECSSQKVSYFLVFIFFPLLLFYINVKTVYKFEKDGSGNESFLKVFHD